MLMIGWFKSFRRRKQPQIKTIVCGGVKQPKRKKKRSPFRNASTMTQSDPLSTGEIKKQLGIGHDKYDPPTVTFFQKIEHKEVGKKKRQWKWNALYVALQTCNSLCINHNMHYGSLRGVDILIAAKRDFRRAGIPVTVKLCGNHGYIELRSKPKNAVEG